MQNLVYLMILSQGLIRCSFLSKTKFAYQNISSDLQLLQLCHIKAGKKNFPFWAREYLLNKNGKTPL